MNEQEIMQTQERLKERLKLGPKRRRYLVETGVMLDLQERQVLDAVAEEMGRSRSDLIREAVQRVWLKNANTALKEKERKI